MTGILEVTPKDIEGLNPRQLHQLLRRLLYLEAGSHGIPESCVRVSLNLDAPDGGEDGYIQWQGGPARTGWLPKRYTLFQCKAKSMYPSECSKEILVRSGNQLKPRVQCVLDEGGAYVLFYYKRCTGIANQRRVAKFREAIKAAGKDYAESADIRVYGAEMIAAWAGQYIAAATAVLQNRGRSIPCGLQTWSQWKQYPPYQGEYIADDALTRHIRTLRQHFGRPQQVARIVGLSGIGKTRLALEAFRPPEAPQSEFGQQTQSDQVIYLKDPPRDGLPRILAEWRANGLSGILIVDNCDIELHQKLQDEVKHGKSHLSLLTLDFSTEKADSEDPFILLEPVSESVIRGIMERVRPGLRKPEIDRIVEFAEGFPQMAVLMAEALHNRDIDIGSLKDNVLVRKLLWGRREENPKHLNVISACALFEYLGYADEVVEQRHFVATEICEMHKEAFYRIAQGFIRRGILDKRHRFIRVVPRPLAIRLAAEWWRECSPERAQRMLLKDMPAGMVERLYDQMSKLHFLDEAKTIVRDLCGEQAHFGQVEVLSSEKGSRLFRSLVEVNPDATVDALAHAFGGWDTDQLRQVRTARLNLVWALQKLCFWADTFPKAARIMLAFAAAENESWGNNAENSFLQLFRILLSGTQAPLQMRLPIVDEALQSSQTEYRILAVRALGQALRAEHFSRAGGVERQGSRAPQQDLRPEPRKVVDYWDACLERLAHIACGDDELASLAREQIVDRVAGLVRWDRLDAVDCALKTICAKKEGFWLEMFNSIRTMLEREGANLPARTREWLNAWLEMLKPNTVPECLRSIVSMPARGQVKKENGHYTDLAEQAATELAKECARELQAFLPNLHIILKGEQRKGYAFGLALGQSLDEPEAFVKQALSVLAGLPRDEVDPTVLGAFLAATRSTHSDFVDHTLERVRQDETLCTYAIDLTRLSKPNRQNLKGILTTVQLEKVRVKELRAFAYGSVLDCVPPRDVLWFCSEITEFGPEALPVALAILFTYCFNDSEKFALCREELRRILLVPGLLNSLQSFTLMDTYDWQEAVDMLLQADAAAEDLARHVATEVVKAVLSQGIPAGTGYALGKLIQTLLSRFRDTTWPVFSKGLLHDDWRWANGLVELFNPRMRLTQMSSGLASTLPEDFLEGWCTKFLEKAPLILPRIVPLVEKRGESWSWHPLAQFLIDEYGDRPEVLSTIYQNIGPFSWIGSMIPYSERKIEVMEKLLDHGRPSVRKWARKRIKFLRQEIPQEKQREDEYDFGVY